MLFTRYSHPLHSNGAPRPATKDHLLAFSNNGAVKGSYRFNGGRWQPYIWRQHEWLLGQAQQNDRDSRWHTLCSENTELSVCYLHLSPDLLAQHALEVGDCDSRLIELPHKMSFKDPLLLQLGLAIKNETEQASPYGKLFVETAASLLSVHLLKNYCVRPVAAKEYDCKLTSITVAKVLDYIHSTLDGDLSLVKMASIANLSTYHFARLFKRTLGVAPHQYVMKVKIQKAKQLLSNSSLPLNVIALEIGYSSNHFAQFFKKNVGVSPTEFRQQS